MSTPKAAEADRRAAEQDPQGCRQRLKLTARQRRLTIEPQPPRSEPRQQTVIGRGSYGSSRRVYHATPQGRAVHAGWVRMPVEPATISRDLALHLRGARRAVLHWPIGARDRAR